MFLLDLIFLQRQNKAAAPGAAEKKKMPSRRSLPAGRETGGRAEETSPAGPMDRPGALPQEDPSRREGGEAFFSEEGRRESQISGRMTANLDAIAECAAKQIRFLRKMTELMRSQSDGTYYL